MLRTDASAERSGVKPVRGRKRDACYQPGRAVPGSVLGSSPGKTSKCPKVGNLIVKSHREISSCSCWFAYGNRPLADLWNLPELFALFFCCCFLFCSFQSFVSPPVVFGGGSEVHFWSWLTPPPSPQSPRSAVTVGLQRHHHGPVDVRGGGSGDVVGGLEGGAQLGDGGGGAGSAGAAQRGHQVEEVVVAALAAGGHALHRLGGHLGGALHAGARARVLAPEQGQEAPVKLGKHTGSKRCDPPARIHPPPHTPPSPSDAQFHHVCIICIFMCYMRK